jgi:ribonucleoside-diphosphate reductase alpha chain
VAKWYESENSMGIMKRKYLHEGEQPSDFIPRLVSIFSDELKPHVRKLFENADFLPAGRTLFGAGYKGKRKVSPSNCFCLPSPIDTIESIMDTAKMIARVSSYGGGCGLALDNLRPKGSPVNNSAMTSSGAVSFLNIFDATGGTIGQNGRRAALMVCLRCDHPDIYEFLRVKQNNEKLASMNISIKFKEDFMEAVDKGEDYVLKFDSPETGLIEKKINAREFFREFCETNWDWGDPKQTWDVSQ